MNRVLDDIRVLDFGRFIACPYCGMMLADMGAEVIRIERPGGEEDRTIGLLGPNGQNMSYPSYARNKKGITLRLMKNEQGREILTDLVKKSDVVIHNFAPDAAGMMGLTYEDLTAMKPDIKCLGYPEPKDLPSWRFFVFLFEKALSDPIVETVLRTALVNRVEGLNLKVVVLIIVSDGVGEAWLDEMFDLCGGALFLENLVELWALKYCLNIKFFPGKSRGERRVRFGTVWIETARVIGPLSSHGGGDGKPRGRG